MILWVLSHISCDTNPWIPTCVFIMVPSNGTGSFNRGWNLIDGSCIPNHDQVDPHLIYASQHNNFVSQIGRPSPTWKKIVCNQSPPPAFIMRSVFFLLVTLVRKGGYIDRELYIIDLDEDEGNMKSYLDSLGGFCKHCQLLWRLLSYNVLWYGQ